MERPWAAEGAEGARAGEQQHLDEHSGGTRSASSLALSCCRLRPARFCANDSSTMVPLLVCRQQFYCYILSHVKKLPKLELLVFDDNPIESDITSFTFFCIQEACDCLRATMRCLCACVCCACARTCALCFALLIDASQLTKLRTMDWRTVTKEDRAQVTSAARKETT